MTLLGPLIMWLRRGRRWRTGGVQLTSSRSSGSSRHPSSPPSPSCAPLQVASTQSHPRLSVPPAMSDHLKAPLASEAKHASRAPSPAAAAAVSPLAQLRDALARLIEGMLFFFDPHSDKARQHNEEIRVSPASVLLPLGRLARLLITVRLCSSDQALYARTQAT